MPEDCLFCKIISKQIPAEIIYEDSGVVAFLDIYPRAPGHVVVIPKKHHAAISELERKDIGGLFTSIQKVAGAVYVALHADGLNVGINDGKAAGQAVNHFHVHILPRFVGDGGTSMHGIVNNPPKESLKTLGEKIRKEIKN